MNKNNTVTIGGKKYDAVTGLPVTLSKPVTPPKQPTHAAGVHASPQKSQTLVRRVTKKPTGATNAARKPGQTMDIARSHSISRFAPHPVTVVKAKPAVVDIPATKHPLLARTHQIQTAKQAPALTSREVKEQAITKALATEAPKVHKKKFIRRHPRFITIASIIVIVAVAVAYVVYLNMPALSVKVAATQAGINATYPQYLPDGYSLNGPVTYTDGAVSIHFAANTGTSKFDITQAKSSWDSTAVLENLVKKTVGDSYITSQERGLTIYTYGNGEAAWVNAGILYTIVGDAPLSGDQIRHIATSL